MMMIAFIFTPCRLAHLDFAFPVVSVPKKETLPFTLVYSDKKIMVKIARWVLLLALLECATARIPRSNEKFYQLRNEQEKYATFGPNQFSHLTLSEVKSRGCFHPDQKELGKQPSKIIKFLDEKEKLKTSYAIRDMNSVSIDWRKKGAVTPVQQQHPFGTCWAFSLVAATEGVMVVQGNQKLQKLSEQFVVSGVPARNCGQGADVNWKWMVENTNGKIQVEEEYPYNRT